METRRVMTPEQAERLAAYVVGLPLPFTITIGNGKSRTVAQNALLWKWNTEIAKHRGDVTAEEVHKENKLLIGCAICMRDDSFREFVGNISHLTYEQKIEAMGYVSVTSRMTTSEMQEYMDSVYRKFTARGVFLTVPDDQIVD